jgi:hypothetical protein
MKLRDAWMACGADLPDRLRVGTKQDAERWSEYGWFQPSPKAQMHEQLLVMLTTVISLIVRFPIDPQLAHEQFSKIDEYRLLMAAYGMDDPSPKVSARNHLHVVG